MMEAQKVAIQGKSFYKLMFPEFYFKTGWYMIPLS